jgi:hypothetical protein
LPDYAHQQRIFFDNVVAASMRASDDPAVVAKVIVTATEPEPKLRYTAGPTAGRVGALRRRASTA